MRANELNAVASSTMATGLLPDSTQSSQRSDPEVNYMPVEVDAHNTSAFTRYSEDTVEATMWPMLLMAIVGMTLAFLVARWRHVAPCLLPPLCKCITFLVISKQADTEDMLRGEPSSGSFIDDRLSGVGTLIGSAAADVEEKCRDMLEARLQSIKKDRRLSRHKSAKSSTSSAKSGRYSCVACCDDGNESACAPCLSNVLALNARLTLAT